MAVESPDELEAFFDVEEFGVVAMFTWDDQQRTVAGLFDDPAITIAPVGLPTSRESSVMSGVGDMTSVQPRFICPTHKVAGIPKRASLSIDGQDYTVSDRRAEGGLTHYFLHMY